MSTLAMIEHSLKDGQLTFKVRVVPRASRSEIVGEYDGALRVRIAASPVDGAANEELTRVIADALGVLRSLVEITQGHASKSKTLRVSGGKAHDLERLANIKGQGGPSPGSKVQSPK